MMKAREIARARLEILIQYPSYERDVDERVME